MKKITSICLALLCVLCIAGCSKSKKDQAREAIDLCVQYTRESFDNPTNEKIANRSTEACAAAQTLLDEYFQSDEFEEDVYNELKETVEALYENK